MKDEDFGNLVLGKAQAQRLFMTGGLKIRGDLMKATKAEVSRTQALLFVFLPKRRGFTFYSMKGRVRRGEAHASKRQ